jgi:hypothetical protein
VLFVSPAPLCSPARALTAGNENAGGRIITELRTCSHCSQLHIALHRYDIPPIRAAAANRTCPAAMSGGEAVKDNAVAGGITRPAQAVGVERGRGSAEGWGERPGCPARSLTARDEGSRSHRLTRVSRRGGIATRDIVRGGWPAGRCPTPRDLPGSIGSSMSLQERQTIED